MNMTTRHKIRYKLYTFFLAAGSLFSTGCSKQLNVYPTTQEVDGNIITDTKSAATALNGVYYRFADAGVDYNNVPVINWASDFEEMPSQLCGMLDYAFGGGGLSEHTYNPKSSYMDVKWIYGSGLVNAANGFLKNVAPLQKIAAADKARMIAEAKFLRAYGNSELLLYYGQYDDTSSPYGIIIHDEFVQPDNIYIARSSVGASYDAILKDIDEAIPALPGKNSIIAYANSWAAKLLKARVLINRGTAADYTAVISLTKDIIANSPFQLEANVKDIFWNKGLASNEVILGVQPFTNVATPKWQGYIRNAYYGPNAFMTDLFSGDPRAGWYMQTVSSAFGPTPAVTKYYPGSPTNIKATAITENSYAFRLTEAYLLEAEAIVASGGSLADAKDLLKSVMGHAGFTDFSTVDAAATADDLQLLIIKEEMKSFACENGQDWLALRRLPFATIQALLPTIVDKHYLILPVPDAEITSNPKVKQNPSY